MDDACAFCKENKSGLRKCESCQNVSYCGGKDCERKYLDGHKPNCVSSSSNNNNNDNNNNKNNKKQKLENEEGIIISFFDEIIKEITPTEEDLTMGKDTIETVTKEFLEFEDRFEDILKTGSFARGTSIHPLHDVDLMLIVKEDDEKKDIPAVLEVLNEIKEIIIDWKINVFDSRVQSRSLAIQLKENDSITIDIVPIRHDPLNKDLFLVPDMKENKWISTDPMKNFRKLDPKSVAWKGWPDKEKLLNFIRLMKYWSKCNSHQLPQNKLLSGATTSLMPSFHMELLIRDFNVRKASSHFFSLVADFLLRTTKTFPHKDFGYDVSNADLVKKILKESSEKAQKAVEHYEKSEFDAALKIWKEMFSESSQNQNNKRELPIISSKLPPSSPFFVGRDKQLEYLTENLKEDHALTTIAISGIPGTGKSQLAIEYGHKSASSQKYNLIRWLKCDNIENFKRSYFSLGDEFGLYREIYKGEKGEQRFFNDINKKILEYQKILLICDNVEKFEEIKEFLPKQSSEGRTFHILVTTREAFGDLNSLNVKVKLFKSEEIQQYLQKRLIGVGRNEGVSVEDAKKLGKELGFLPLAIVQATGYIVTHFISLQMFLNLLKDSKSRLTFLDNTVSNEIKSISSLWSITVDKLSKQALVLLRLCSLLDPDNIPRAILENFEFENDGNNANFSDVLPNLFMQSLLVSGGNVDGKEYEVFRIHRLLQEVVERQMIAENKELPKELIETSVKAIKKFLGDDRIDDLDDDKFMFWKTQNPLIIQIKHLIPVGQKHHIGDEYLAQLLEWQGEYQRVVEVKLKESIYSYEKCLELRRKVFGDNHLLVGDALIGLGLNKLVSNRFDFALTNFNQALTIFEKFEEEKKRISLGFNCLGRVYERQGSYDFALENYQKSLVIRKEIYGENHPKVAAILNNIGNFYGYQGNYDEAMKCFQHCLKIRKCCYGIDHPSIAVSFFNIGLMYELIGKYEEALKSHQQALVIRRSIYKENLNHPDVAHSLGAIGTICQSQTKFEEALKHHQQALKILRSIYDENHKDIAISLGNIGDIYYDLEKYEEAMKYDEEALKIFKIVYGLRENHFRIAEILNNIGKVHLVQKDFEKSMECHQKALTIFKSFYNSNPNHKDIGMTLFLIANVYSAQQNYSEALNHYQQALQIQQIAFNNDNNHPDIKTTNAAIESIKDKVPQ